jgi:hypothetical protein
VVRKVTRKRHTAEILLSLIVRAIDREQFDLARFQRAVIALLTDGPIRARQTLAGIPLLYKANQAAYIEELSLARAEMLAFLESVVRLRTHGEIPTRISTYEMLNFAATAAGSAVTCEVTGSVRDVAVLELVLLLQEVGLGQLQRCGAPDCPRLFVKTYRREFCSIKCQKRVYMRVKRQNEKDKRARKRAKRRRARTS